MTPAIHYEFIAKIIKRKNKDEEFEFIETRKEFHDDEPIRAREQVFRYYQNYVEVMLESKGLKYESFTQARMALDSYLNPNKENTKNYNGTGIGIMLVIDNPIDYNLSKRKEEMERFIDETDIEAIKNANIEDLMKFEESLNKYEMIHSIGDISYISDSPESLMCALEREYEYFTHFKYDTGNHVEKIVFCDSNEWLEGYRDDEPQAYKILKTPFDWSGMNRPYWWGEPEEKNVYEIEKHVIPEFTYEDIIRGGERNLVEFKPSLLYNFKTKKASIGVKGIIAKSICAFLNSKGGFLFIGLNDDGTVQGLNYDFSLAEKRSPTDFFMLEFDDMINQFLPLFTKTLISGEIISIDNKLLFVVKVFPSTSKPVFMKGQHGKEFWVRWTASKRQYKDIEDITNYCLEHWCKKN